MRYFIFLGFLICHSIAFARVTPTQIESSQIKNISKTLSGVFASRTANDPSALGEDFEFELSAFYQNLNTSDINTIDPSTSEHFLDSILSLKKGLYWNLDFSISTALPIPSNMISGFSFNLEHTSKIGSFILKPDLYISHYNLNDILNIESVGFSLVVYKKLKLVHIGLGANLESVSSVYNQNFLSGQLAPSESNEIEFIETALISKISTRLGAFRFTATYLFRDKQSSLLNFAVGKRF
jgi:hypothetical protein